jgi:hypothetical protein
VDVDEVVVEGDEVVAVVGGYAVDTIGAISAHIDDIAPLPTGVSIASMLKVPSAGTVIVAWSVEVEVGDSLFVFVWLLLSSPLLPPPPPSGPPRPAKPGGQNGHPESQKNQPGIDISVNKIQQQPGLFVKPKTYRVSHNQWYMFSVASYSNKRLISCLMLSLARYSLWWDMGSVLMWL